MCVCVCTHSFSLNVGYRRDELTKSPLPPPSLPPAMYATHIKSHCNSNNKKKTAEKCWTHIQRTDPEGEDTTYFRVRKRNCSQQFSGAHTDTRSYWMEYIRIRTIGTHVVCANCMATRLYTIHTTLFSLYRLAYSAKAQPIYYVVGDIDAYSDTL